MAEFDAEPTVIEFWPADGWHPTGTLAQIPIRPDCDATNGRMSLTRRTLAPPFAEILYCPETVQAMHAAVPHSTHVFFMAETGHYHTRSSDVRKVDAWLVATLLDAENGAYYLTQAARWLDTQTALECPPYGMGPDRAAHLRTLMNAKASPD